MLFSCRRRVLKHSLLKAVSDVPSNLTIGATLFQVYADVEHPICYFSKKLDKHQKRYATVEKEALSLVHVTGCDCLKLQQYNLNIVHTECNPGTRAPENSSNPLVFKPVNPGLCAGKNPGLTGLISNVSTAQKSVQKQKAVKMRQKYETVKVAIIQ